MRLRVLTGDAAKGGAANGGAAKNGAPSTNGHASNGAATNGHANGHLQVPPPDAPAFEIGVGGQVRKDPN